MKWKLLTEGCRKYMHIIIANMIKTYSAVSKEANKFFVIFMDEGWKIIHPEKWIHLRIKGWLQEYTLGKN